MLIEVKQLKKQISDLNTNRNSLYAKIEVLKLRGPNHDQNLIDQKKQLLSEIESKLSALEKILSEIK